MCREHFVTGLLLTLSIGAVGCGGSTTPPPAAQTASASRQSHQDWPTGHYRVVPYGQGSRVVIDLDIRAPGPRRFVLSLVDRSTRSDLARDLARLKVNLEGVRTGVRAG